MLSESFKKPSLTLQVRIGSPDRHTPSSYTLPNAVSYFCLHEDLSLDLKLVLFVDYSLAPRTGPINTCQTMRKRPALLAQGSWDIGLWVKLSPSLHFPSSLRVPDHFLSTTKVPSDPLSAQRLQGVLHRQAFPGATVTCLDPWVGFL